MIKRIILSLFIILGVGGSAVLGTQALLDDSVTLTANSVSTGTVNLQINKNLSGGTWVDTQSGLFSETLYPGQTVTKFFRLRSLDTDVDLAISGVVISTSGAISPDEVIVTILPVDIDSVSQGVGATGTLTAWLTPQAIVGPNVLASGIQQRYKMVVAIDEDVDESGASAVFDFQFTGTQVEPE